MWACLLTTTFPGRIGVRGLFDFWGCNFQSRAAEARNFEQSSLRLRKGAVFECTPSKNNGVTNDDLKNEIEAAVNRCLEAVDSTLPKLEVIDVNLRVIEAKELKFDIDF